MKQSANQPYGKKAINFDLDISKMLATIGSKTAGYDRLKRAFKKMGFEHVQGSGYISKKPMTSHTLARILRNIVKNNSWIGFCLNSMIESTITDTFDITNMVIKNAQFEQRKAERKKKANAQAAVSKGSAKTVPKLSSAPKTAPQSKKIPTQQVTCQKKISKGISL